MSTRFSLLSREVRIAILVTLSHALAGYLLMRGAGPSFSALPGTPIWTMSAEMLSDSAANQVQVDATQPVAAVAVAKDPPPDDEPQQAPAEPVVLPVVTPKNEVLSPLVAVSMESQGNSGMLRITPIALPDEPPVAFVPPPSMAGPLSKSQEPAPCRDLKETVPNNKPERVSDLRCKD